MITFQEFLEEKDRDINSFIRRALSDHANDPMVQTAIIADEYNHQRNRTVMNYAKWLYDMNGMKIQDTVSSTNRIACNYFRRLNVQRNTYLLGNGVSFADNRTKEKLGSTFDSAVKNIAYKSLIHGVSFGFWNNTKLINFTIHEFIPFWNEETSALSAGIRFWQLSDDKPMNVTVYEADGYTDYIEMDNVFVQKADKRAYKTIVQHTDFGGDEVVGTENYSDLPIKAMWGSELHQSTLIGLRPNIDAYDLIKSGFANDLDDCAEIYWLISNASGMDEVDMTQFRDRLKLQHIAKVDRDQAVTPYTQEVPSTSRETLLNRIKADIYEDFGALDVHTVAAGATNDHIDAAYQPMDEEADDFEFQVTEFIKQILELIGIEDEPVYKRNRISNQMEQVQMLIMEAPYLDEETIISKLPNITVDEVEAIMKRKSAEDLDRFRDVPEEDEEESVPAEEGAENG